MSTALRVAVAEDDADTREFLEKLLPTLGHTVSSVARTGKELVDHCRTAAPDLIITDVKMPGMTGLEAVAAVNEFAAVPSILLTGHSAPGWVDRARDIGVMAYLMKPITEYDLVPAIALARRHFDEVRGLRKEAADLKQALEDRKVIERAKGAVVRRVGVPEGDAYRRLRKIASDSNRKLAEVAAEVIAAEDIFRRIESLPGG